MFRRVPVLGSLVRFVPSVVEQGLSYPMAKGEQVRQSVVLDHPLNAPIKAGERLGKLFFYLGDTLIGETDLVAARTVYRDVFEPQTMWERLRERLN